MTKRKPGSTRLHRPRGHVPTLEWLMQNSVLTLRVPELGECWEWRHAKTPPGYGVLGSGYVHRVAATIAHGEPGGLHALHACDNPPCCNPQHLRWGTRSQNIAEAVERRGGPWGAAAEDHSGERHHGHILSWGEVDVIRSSRKQGALVADFADTYGVSRATIYDITSNRSWKETK